MLPKTHWGISIVLLLFCHTLWSEYVNEGCILYSENYGELLNSDHPDVALWWASSGWKVSRDRTLPTRKSKEIRIELAQNEREAAQLVVRPEKELSHFSAKPTVLIGSNQHQIAAECVEVLWVRYLHIQRVSDTLGTVGLWPDPLPPIDSQQSLEAQLNQPLWIRVYAPKGTPAGTYRGHIVLKADGYEQAVPLSLRVYGFELPDRASCKTAFGFSAGSVYQYQGLVTPEDKRAILNKYWESFRDHRISPYDPAPDISPALSWEKGVPDFYNDLSREALQIFDEEALCPRIDWADWDHEMERCFNHYYFNTFRVSVPGVNASQYQGFPADSPAYTYAFNAYGRSVQEHLRARGWLDKAYVYPYDEPTEADYPRVLKGFHQLRAAMPDMALMLTEQVEPGLIGGPNLWCPLISFYNHEKAEERRKEGEHFWWYICTGPKQPYPGLFIDHPGTDLRVWLWMTWKYHIEGILIWQSNLWTTAKAYPDHPQNPYEDPMSWMSDGNTKPGDKRPWGNGDGRFLYPPESAADARPTAPILEGPVESIRWEMLRDGVEDYEYFVILKQAIHDHEAALSESEKAAYIELTEVPRRIVRDRRNYTKDPALLERQRSRIAKTIEKLMQQN